MYILKGYMTTFDKYGENCDATWTETSGSYWKIYDRFIYLIEELNQKFFKIIPVGVLMYIYEDVDVKNIHIYTSKYSPYISFSCDNDNRTFTFVYPNLIKYKLVMREK